MTDEPKNNNIDNETEAAFTAPAGKDFQFHSNTASSEPDDEQPVKPLRRNLMTGLRVRIAIVIIILASVVLVSTRIIKEYNVKFIKTDDGFRLSMSKDEAEDGELSESESGDSGSGSPWTYTWGSGTNTAMGTMVRSEHSWDGSRMTLDASTEGEKLTLSQIYDKCAPSTALIKIKDSNGIGYMGIGAVMSDDGYIVTNSHLLLAGQEVTVNVAGTDYVSTLVGFDTSTDLAVLKIEAQGLTPAEFGDSNYCRAGSEIAVIGNPVGDNINIVRAEVSSIDEDFNYLGINMQLMQIYITLGINASGSLVVNEYGKVVGMIDTLFYWSFPEATGISFAQTINDIKPIVDELLEYGYIKGRPRSGITATDIPPGMAEYFGYPQGVYISDVNEQSTAFEAGVRRGDVILEANGIMVKSANELYAMINSLQAGDEFSLHLYRNKETGYVTFKLMEASMLY